jgi:hypothetical protein
MRKTVTHYPSRFNFQRSTDRVVPLTWAIAYLQSLKKAIPEDEQDDATITWPPTIVYDHTLSPLEVAEDRRQRARDWIEGLPATGADADAIARLRAILAAP